MRRLLQLAVTMLVLCTAGLANAEDVNLENREPTSSHDQGAIEDRSPHHRPQMLSFFLGLPYYYGFYGGFPVGLSARYYIPIAHDGFIPKVNDEFGIEFGADFAVFSYPQGAFFGLSIPVEVLWDFHFHPRFDAYVKAGLAFSANFGPYGNYVRYPYGIYPVGALGLRFKLGEVVSLRFELGYPWAKLGLGFAI